jgi:uncharacterized protein (DUF1330 family)
MAAYLIVDLDVTDPEGFKEYQTQVGATLDMYGGKYIVRGGNHEILEGEWHLHRLIIIEFDSEEQCKRWVTSPEYAPLLEIRHRTANTQAVWVQGV